MVRDDIVQIRNPQTNRYIKINRTTGEIIAHKRSPEPYKNIPVIKGKE